MIQQWEYCKTCSFKPWPDDDDVTDRYMTTVTYMGPNDPICKIFTTYYLAIHRCVGQLGLAGWEAFSFCLDESGNPSYFLKRPVVEGVDIDDPALNIVDTQPLPENVTRSGFDKSNDILFEADNLLMQLKKEYNFD